MLYWYLYMKEWLREESGQSMHEYVTILGLIIVGCIATLTVLGYNATDLYDTVNNGIDSSMEVNSWYNG